jgi:bifunctional non-homologous end joining protein LigD
MARTLPNSKRQYVQGLNTPTKELIRSFKNAEPGPRPEFIEPLFPELRDRPPSGDNWVHEIKFDGYRFQIHVGDGIARILTRRGHDWTGKARAIAADASTLKTYSAIIDGEVVVVSDNGLTDFNELERELGKGTSDRLTFYAFDLLYVDAHDIRRETLLNRKLALKVLLQTLPKSSPIKYSEHMEGDARTIQKSACGAGLEGIVSKLKDGRYISGHNGIWTKSPCRQRDTFVIVGWASKGRKFDGFYLGEARKGKLVYAGKIEGGWTEKQKNELIAEVEQLQRRTSPLFRKVEKPKARWVDPQVLVDVEYRAKTKASGLLRHPTFKGVRRELMEDLTKPRKRSAAGRPAKRG